MHYDPNIHHRHSIRLRGYDYSRAGLYFITIVVQNRMHLFGHVVNGEMELNDAGRMIEKWYYELENKYPDKRCHEMVVMPNHFHCIIENMDGIERIADKWDDETRIADNWDAHVGAPLRGRPINDERGRPINDECGRPINDDSPYGMHNQKFGATVGDAMDWFKTMTTNEYIRGVKKYYWARFNGRLWQHNYYEHIIRDEQSYERIANYIVHNPEKWDADQLNRNEAAS